MQDEVRVTVVATGLNPVNAGRIAPRTDNYERTSTPQRRPQVELVRPKLDGTTGLPVDAVSDPYNPTQSISSVLRGRSQGTASAAAEPSAAPAIADLPSDYLNIPAFLRRQAD